MVSRGICHALRHRKFICRASLLFYDVLYTFSLSYTHVWQHAVLIGTAPYYSQSPQHSVEILRERDFFLSKCQVLKKPFTDIQNVFKSVRINQVNVRISYYRTGEMSSLCLRLFRFDNDRQLMYRHARVFYNAGVANVFQCQIFPIEGLKIVHAS